MRAAVLQGAGKITLEERPRPTPGPRDVLVRVSSVGTCGSDVHYYEHGRIGDFVVESPLVLGHEPSGTVVAAGPGAGRHRPGQRVSLEPGVPDFTCPQCRASRYNLCPRMRFSAPLRSTGPSASTSSCARSSPILYRTRCPMTPPP
ncbi:alcohol dehydrogenase catalytic domain-containing protein [Streptosporangium lutulentum]